MRRIAPSSSVSTPSKRSRSRSTKLSRKVKPYAPAKVSVGRQLFPKQLFNTLTYCERMQGTLSVGASNYIRFRCNGMYDPNHTGAGHQPMGFDQLCAIYDHWRVLRSRITVDFVEVTAAGQSDLVVGVYIDDDTTIATGNINGILERPNCHYKVCNGTDLGPSTRITHSWDGYKVFGPSIYASDALQGTAAADPTEQQIYLCFFQDANAIINPNYVGLTVKIEYDVVWDELADLPMS